MEYQHLLIAYDNMHTRNNEAHQQKRERDFFFAPLCGIICSSSADQTDLFFLKHSCFLRIPAVVFQDMIKMPRYVTLFCNPMGIISQEQMIRWRSRKDLCTVQNCWLRRLVFSIFHSSITCSQDTLLCCLFAISSVMLPMGQILGPLQDAQRGLWCPILKTISPAGEKGSAHYWDISHGETWWQKWINKHHTHLSFLPTPARCAVEPGQW